MSPTESPDRRQRVLAFLKRELPFALLAVVLWTVLVLVGGVRFAAWGYLLGIPAAAATYLVLRGLRFSRGVGAILVAALALYSVYFVYTAPGERNFDLGAEMLYVDYIVEHGELPASDECFVCHHPPLFYLASVPARLYYGKEKKALRVIQVQSLVYCGVLLLFSALIFRRTLRTERAVTASIALMAFWPYTVMNSVRLHNDVLAGTFMVVSLYFAVRFYQEEQRWALALGALFGIGAALTKVNGYAAVATVGVVGAIYIVRKWGKAPWVWAILLSMTLAAAVHMGGRQESNADVSAELFGSAGTLPGRRPLGNAPSNFLTIDLPMYLDQPFVLARQDGTGRQSYPHQLLKSSLFATGNRASEPELAYRFNTVIATFMGLILLGMFGISLGRLAWARPAELARHLPLLVFGSVLLAAHMAFRISEAVGHHGDFRHVYPVLVCTIPLFLSTVDRWLEDRRAMGYVSGFATLAFIGGSVLFYTPKETLVAAVSIPDRRITLPLHEVAVPKRQGEKWEHPENTFIPPDAYLALTTPVTRVDEVELSVDWNDVYLVKVIGTNRTFVHRISPKKDKSRGLQVYRFKVRPPLTSVREIRVEHVSGDIRFVLGHLLINPPPVPSEPAAPDARPSAGRALESPRR